MSSYSLTHLPDSVLLHDLDAVVGHERRDIARVVAHIGEVDARRLYLPAGYGSMFAYCVERLRLSEDAAYPRIRVARAARRFPGLFVALADGRLSLTAISLLAPHLTPENFAEVLAEATHRRKSEIEELLVRRFAPEQAPVKAGVIRAMPITTVKKLVPERVGRKTAASSTVDLLGEPVPNRVAPPPAERFLLSCSLSKATHDKLRHAQALLSHAVPSGDVAEVLDHALDLAIAELEKRKFAATDRPRQATRTGIRPRHIPARVKRAVWKRDRGQCTYVGTTGKRCGERRFLEFDHIDPVARGGRASIARMRLRCRAHNQYDAERTYGASFMDRKRRQSSFARPEGQHGLPLRE